MEHASRMQISTPRACHTIIGSIGHGHLSHPRYSDHCAANQGEMRRPIDQTKNHGTIHIDSFYLYLLNMLQRLYSATPIPLKLFFKLFQLTSKVK